MQLDNEMDSSESTGESSTKIDTTDIAEALTELVAKCNAARQSGEALSSGKVSASWNEHGQWRLNPAEAAGGAEQQRATPRNRGRTDELVAQLREQLSDMRNERDRARNDAETWRNAFETERAHRLALAAPKPERPMTWWRWLRATG